MKFFRIPQNPACLGAEKMVYLHQFVMSGGVSTKKHWIFVCLLLLCTSLCGCSVGYQGPNGLTWGLAVLGMIMLVFGILRIRSILHYTKHHKTRTLPKEEYYLTAMILVAGLILMVLGFITLYAPLK